MQKAIVTTTINAPTPALKKFIAIAADHDWHVFIVGDKKTPAGPYRQIASIVKHVTYIDPEAQEAISQELSDLIGWNCIQRRNFGFIAAYKWGADIIATVDDDNIPLENWGKDLLVGTNADVQVYPYKEDVSAEMFLFDPLAPTTHGPNMWHRGFPVQMLKGRTRLAEPAVQNRFVAVQADLWNGEPDIDAICRIARGSKPVSFKTTTKAYAGAKPGPFNSQNTFVHRSVLRDYFMFPHIGRMDDIWASYYLQATHPGQMAYGPASVRQDRNDHNLVKDLEAELIGYNNSQAFAQAMFDSKITHQETRDAALKKFIGPQPYIAFKLYQGLIDGAA